MSKEKQLKDLPLYRKLLLFSFFITLMIVISTAGFTFIFQTEQLENQLTDRVKGLASLWSTTIDPIDVQLALDSHDKDNSYVKKLSEQVSMLNDKNSNYIGGFIIDGKMKNVNQLTFISISKHYEAYGLDNFYLYQPGKEFLTAYNTAIKEKVLTNTKVYRDETGEWITAFYPIMNDKDKVIALLAVDVDAAIIENFQEKIAFYLIFSFLIVSIIVYFTLRWGLKKALAPVHEIISGINAVSAGNFNVKLNITDQADMEELSDKFNHMTEKLSILFERLSDTSKKLGSNSTSPSNIHRIEEAIGEMDNIIAKTKIQKELQRAEKMNAIGQLAASVAHEIRNPMTVVKGFLQLFLAKDHFSSEELMFVQLMIDELNRAEMIINDYLSLAKPNLEQIEKVDGSELAHNVMDLMNTFALMKQNITLKVDIDSEIQLKGNNNEMKQVLINIVKNGIEAMRNGGTLSLKVYQQEEYGVFEVTDTGIGMSPEELARLGTAFYSLKEKGTGMGLMVCYQIIEKMKGQIDVISEKDKGTTFRVFIPVWTE
ncbi:signal transduction histidine kinase [Neobacillus niacini]|uniref:ATP-binding protein n=1 Tax=Neobacillus niacini TaxID=86668 RepID=UPI002861B828|nr:ATP-binding protein [Neobacillus niacini]MDR7075400.1 signal transduction histidine kinase [Neobacillus niacini]